ncbi:hypothetical protein C6P40_000910 [Pichia californica]|uniref:Thioredoxin domain-containing protein n=1 Tax=Pichia californica TaxID=460514 RepID=A0A9P7BGM5_9ASCO|nr:hypothetical protein C6P42_003097 [[Candida] californica]KAG0688473.1 hypothetical protein C6P40_000910 [[Candida] californica]
MVKQILLFVLLLTIQITNTLASPPSAKNNNELHARIPPPLTSNNFDSSLKEGFHVVEFFSPSCPHCVQLLPKWVEFYEMHNKNNKNLNTNTNDDSNNDVIFKIHQVDCLASGDLCDREGIQYYPMIRFYGAGSRLLGSMTNNDRNADTITEFVEEQVNVWSSSHGKYDPVKAGVITEDDKNLLNKNTLISTSDLLSVIEGENTIPRLISFWPTTDEQLNDDNFQEDYKNNKIFSYFHNLFSFRNLWNLTIKNLKKYSNDDKLQFNYFNCQSNKEICESLGFSSLNSFKINPRLSPEIILCLPKSNGGNAIYYKKDFNQFRNLNSAVKSLTHWTYRTLVNSEFQDLSFNDIKDFVDAPIKLKNKEQISEFTDYSKVAFIQINDPETYVSEDDSLLDRLLQPIADLDSDVYLFKTSDKEAALKFLKNQETSMIDKYIHLKDESNAEKEIKFDESIFVARTHSSFPMMICIKSGTLYSPVYTSFISKQMRDYNKIMTFIKRNYLPTINHLSIENKNLIFPNKFAKNINDQTERVLITFTDFQPKQFFKVEYFMSYIFHKFIHINNEHKYLEREDSRIEKYEEVNKLKKDDASSDDIIDALREKIDISFTTTDNHVYPVYVDVKHFSGIVESMGWSNLDSSHYQSGDVLLVDRFGGKFWDKDLNGNKLKIDDPKLTIELLQSVSYDAFKGNDLHSLSIWVKVPLSIIITIIAIIFIRLMKSFLQKKKLHLEKMKGLGILGVSPDLEESKFD